MASILRRLFGRQTTDSGKLLREKYLSFRELLSANNEVLQTVADMAEKLTGDSVFGMGYVRSRCTDLAVQTYKIIDHLQRITGSRDPDLEASFERINQAIQRRLALSRKAGVDALVLPFSAISADHLDDVGGKSLNLALLYRDSGVPVPPGFAVTARAWELFSERNRLRDRINKAKLTLSDHPAAIEEAARSIAAIFEAATLPPEVEEAILAAWRRLREESGCQRVAMRSSAVGEDSSESSFAGLHASFLGVTEDELLASYKLVLASKYTPRAIFYRLSRGIRDEDVAMCATCLAMIDSARSGVAFCRDPGRPLEETLVIHAVWGLGQYAVDGTVSPDLYRVSRDTLEVLGQRLGGREVKLVLSEAGGVVSTPVSPEERERFCLSTQEAQEVARAALRLEERYGGPQDVEWAIDPAGKLFILQTRPQRIEVWQPAEGGEEGVLDLSAYRPLVEQAEVASRGIAAGFAHLAAEGGLEDIPQGAVLVVENTSPAYVAALGRVAAIVADRGGSTGHLAIIAREFGVPALVGARHATSSIPEGAEVTVDAVQGRVFEGRVEPLLALMRRPAAHRMPKDSQVYKTLEAVMEHIAPLNLTNPHDRQFRSSNAATIHDIARFAHESAINAMFELNDTWSHQSGLVKRLKVRVPLDLCLIDLGGGLAPEVTGMWVRPEQVTSVPMRALLAGMTAPGVRWAGHINIDLKGLFSVFANTLYDPAKAERPLGGRSYAIVSANYVNFSSRLGYHFTVIDAYCSEVRNDNYVTFRFKGGAADLERRTRRAAFIARVLRELGFWVSQKLDLVNARVKKLERAEIEEKLDMVGRLLGCARQLDVTMVSDATVDHYVGEFMRGNYSFAAAEAQP